jgi:HEAT repeat protein
MTEIGRLKRGEALALALAAGRTVREACRECGISERTAYRRLEDPTFRHLVTEARSEMIKRAVGALADDAVKAADTLRNLLKAESENIRLGAARSILELGTKLRESVELEDRLVALEERFTGARKPLKKGEP